MTSLILLYLGIGSIITIQHLLEPGVLCFILMLWTGLLICCWFLLANEVSELLQTWNWSNFSASVSMNPCNTTDVQTSCLIFLVIQPSWLWLFSHWILELNFLPTCLYFIVLPPDHTHRCYKAFPRKGVITDVRSNRSKSHRSNVFFISLRRVTQENLIWQQKIPAGQGKVGFF